MLCKDYVSKRVERYHLKNIVSDWLNPTRVYPCHRFRKDKDAEVQVRLSRKKKRASVTGLICCALGWVCPVCSLKISERKRAEIDQAMILHRDAGGHMSFVTYTIWHHSGQSFAMVQKNLQDSRDLYVNRTSYKTFAREIGLFGSIRALDLTWGPSSGPHVHIHEVLFHSHPIDHEALQTRLRAMWTNVGVTLGLRPPNDHGVVLKEGRHSGEYLSKWGLGRELAKTQTKQANEGRFSIFDLVRNGKKRQFQEFAKAFAGKQQIVWSKGLKARFGIVEKTDKEHAEAIDDPSDVLGTLTELQLKRVVEDMPGLLSAAESGGWSAVVAFARSKVPEYKAPRMWADKKPFAGSPAFSM